jgi:hypothetical protein
LLAKDDFHGIAVQPFEEVRKQYGKISDLSDRFAPSV